MVNNIDFTSIRVALDNLSRHPMLTDITLEQVAFYALRFIGLHGYNNLYTDKIAEVDIEDYRGVLPCGLIRIIQVKDLKTNTCMRSMTDSFTPGLESNPRGVYGEHTFKTTERVIFTSFKDGKVEIAYKAIPVDDEGLPKLLNNETYLAAFEAYVKRELFEIKFEQGKIAQNIYLNAKKNYANLSGELKAEIMTPSLSEMEAISREMRTLIPRTTEFDNGFKTLGDREYLKNVRLRRRLL